MALHLDMPNAANCISNMLNKGAVQGFLDDKNSDLTNELEQIITKFMGAVAQKLKLSLQL